MIYVCILWLFQGDGSLSINAKGGDATLVSNLLDEVKAFYEHSINCLCVEFL